MSLLSLVDEAHPLSAAAKVFVHDANHEESNLQVSLLTALSVFLLAVSRFTSLSLFKEIMVFLARVGRSANLKGAIYELNLRQRLASDEITVDESSKEVFLESDFLRSDLDYWQTHSSERIPEILLGYLLESFPADIEPSAMYLHEKEGVYPNIFGVEEVNLVRAITLCSLLCRWLLGHGLVPSSFTVEGCPKIYTPFLQDHTKTATN